MATNVFAPGGYRFIPAVFQYSGGVAAEAGFEIVRVRFSAPVPLAEGFSRVEQAIRAAGRPLTAFCACELRSPAPFTEDGFRAFNEVYAGTLQKWGIYDGKTNPVARSNVCPEIDPPGEPSFHAFSFTVPAKSALPTFVVAGSGEAVEGKGNYRDNTVRFGETSPDAIAEKARYVLGEMERRLKLLGFCMGRDDREPSLHRPRPAPVPRRRDRAPRRRARGAHVALRRPPVRDLEYEMDCRAVADERVI